MHIVSMGLEMIVNVKEEQAVRSGAAAKRVSSSPRALYVDASILANRSTALEYIFPVDSEVST